MTRRPSLVLSVGAALALAACVAPSSVTPAASPAPAPVDASGPGAAVSADAALERGAATITAADFISRVTFLASDVMRGRDTPSRELNIAAEALADHYRRLGAEPAGENGTYYQWYPFPLMGLTQAETRLNFATARRTESLRLGRDFFTRGGTAADVSGGLVFVGRGTQEQFGAAGSLRERIAVVSLPGRNVSAWRVERNRQVSEARRAGASAVVHVLDAVWTADSIARYAELAARPVRSLGGVVAFPQFFVTQAAARRIFATGNVNFDQVVSQAGESGFRPITLSGVTVVGAAPVREIERSMAPNVVAVLRGSDPVLRNEYVVVSSHFDHVGVGAPDARGDSIYNGADDDASGTTGVMEIAEALASLPTRPRRSVVFLNVSGEEKGLLGSEWYADHPTLPLNQIVANVNIDMIGRNAPDSIVVIGKEYSTLGRTVNEVRARHPELNLVAADDIWPEERFFFRSDHFNFARKEVPVIFFFNGVHEDYHRPSDHAEKIDEDKGARVSRLIYYLVNDIANADQRPQWDPRGLEEVRNLTR
ncbi:MAG TPA: M28 family peptidase [Longimicrobiaceae bacterium]|nr:M28 family peptidase [Longimicrobiaceae bacterium]